MSFLFKQQEILQPEHVGCVRVLVIGDAGVGKSSLTQLISSGSASRSVKATQGCNVSIKLLSCRPNAANSGSPRVPEHFFVELWDVSGQPPYQGLRKLFYRQVNGVILVYDAADRASLRKLTAWASEVTMRGSFVAPLADAQAAANIGGLPVPVLVIANKADRLRRRTGGGSAAQLCIDSPGASDAGSCGGSGAAAQLYSALVQRAAGFKQRRKPSDLHLPDLAPDSAPGAAASVVALDAAAASGQADLEAIDEFFRSLWERRYHPSLACTGSGRFLVPQVTPPIVPNLIGTLECGDGGSSADRRLDDDWV